MFSLTTLGVNAWKGEGVFELKGNVGTKANEHILAMNKYGLEIKRQLPSIRKVRSWNSFSLEVKKKNLSG